MKRRHLDASQKAGITVKALPLYEAEAKERQRKHGETAPGKKNTGGNHATSDRALPAIMREVSAKVNQLNWRQKLLALIVNMCQT